MTDWSTHPDALALLDFARAAPFDPLARNILADWLVDNGQRGMASLLKLSLRAPDQIHHASKKLATCLPGIVYAVDGWLLGGKEALLGRNNNSQPWLNGLHLSGRGLGTQAQADLLKTLPTIWSPGWRVFSLADFTIPADSFTTSLERGWARNITHMRLGGPFACSRMLATHTRTGERATIREQAKGPPNRLFADAGHPHANSKRVEYAGAAVRMVAGGKGIGPIGPRRSHNPAPVGIRQIGNAFAPIHTQGEPGKFLPASTRARLFSGDTGIRRGHPTAPEPVPFQSPCPGDLQPIHDLEPSGIPEPDRVPIAQGPTRQGRNAPSAHFRQPNPFPHIAGLQPHGSLPENPRRMRLAIRSHTDRSVAKSSWRPGCPGPRGHSGRRID